MGDLKRADNDWYSDPPMATEALLRVETFPGQSWDPACGIGTIPNAMRGHGYDCFASDIVDRGYPTAAIIDFLKDEPEGTGIDVDHIVSNPPYGIAQAWAEHALSIASSKIALLLPLTFLEGQRRTPWLESTPLARVHVFSWRISMPPGHLLHAGEVKAEGGKKAFAWFVWEHGWFGPPQIRFLHKEAA